MTQTRVVLEPKGPEDLVKELKDIDEGHFSAAAIIMAFASKKARRQTKNKPEFNGFVLDCSSDLEKYQAFLKFLEDNQSCTQDLRFQVVYNFAGHCAMIDIRIHNKKAEFCFIDPANDWQIVFVMIGLLYSRLPEARVSYIGMTNQEDTGLQTDGHNCAPFSIDMAFVSSKMRFLHVQLSMPKTKTVEFFEFNYKNSIKEGLNERLGNDSVGQMLRLNREQTDEALEKVNLFPFQAFTSEMGPLLRNAQLPTVLYTMVDPDKLKGNAELSLRSYIDPHLVENKEATDERMKLKNDAIKPKRRSIKMKTLAFFESSQTPLETILHDQNDYQTFLYDRAIDLPTQVFLIEERLSKKTLGSFKNITPDNSKGLYKLFRQESCNFQDRESHIRKYKDKPFYTITREWLKKQDQDKMASLLETKQEALQAVIGSETNVQKTPAKKM